MIATRKEWTMQGNNVGLVATLYLARLALATVIAQSARPAPRLDSAMGN